MLVVMVVLDYPLQLLDHLLQEQVVVVVAFM
jgi:hypothetical protein